MTSSHSFESLAPPAAILAVVFGVLVALVGAAPASAQTGSVGGVVVAEETGQPLAGAEVSVAGTNQGTLTGPDGRFLLRGLSGTQVQLRVALLGYGSVTRSVPVGELALRITLSPSAIELDRIVVTGTAGQQTKRALGNVVSTVDAAAITELAPVSSMNELLNGRVAGVTILSTTGVVGGSSRVTIRGASSFSLSNAPLIYVDGIRVNNDETSGPSNQGFGNQSISRFNDFDPENIESIEIIKGPAAATLYGTEAANGVIQIITKKGRAGGTRVDLTVSQGANWFANPEDRIDTNYGMIDGELRTISFSDLAAQEERLGNRPLFQTGHLQRYDLSVSGGSDLLQYYLAGGYERNEGVEPTNVGTTGTGRLNLSVVPSEEWRIQGNVGFVDGTINLPCEAGCGGNTWATFFAQPRAEGDPRRNFTSRPPEFYHEVTLDWQDVTRFTGSVQVNHTPTPWFSQRLAFGRDQTQEENNSLFHRDDRFTIFTSFAGVGSRSITDRQIDYTTFDYGATVDVDVTDRLTSSTSVGAQYYGTRTDFTFAYGEGFPVPGLTSVNATTVNKDAGASFVENTTVGVYVQEQLSSLNRRFLTLGLRADDNSAFGQNFDLVYYPKVSGAWVLSEEPFFDIGAVNTLRLRAAFGESGQQPAAFAAIRTFQPETGPGDVGTITPLSLGNPDLGPERTRELELGFEAGFLGDRLGVEFTYYDQQTRDAILLREIAPSTGFSGVQWVNAGTVDNSGVELLLRGTPYHSDRVGWELSFNVGTNDNEVVSFGDVTDENFLSAGSFVQHRIGHPLGSWFGARVVSAEVDAEGKAINLMCDDGSGGTTPCLDADENLIAPDVFLGRNIPKVTGGVNTTVTLFQRLRLFGQVDFKTGFSKLDGNERVRCWFFDRCFENFRPAESDPVVVAGYQQFIPSSIIEKADFAKLREVSASFLVPTTWSDRLGVGQASLKVAGRNLFTWTDYTGLEPEATFSGGGRRGGQYELWEQSVLPQLAQFVASVNVSF